MNQLEIILKLRDETRTPLAQFEKAVEGVRGKLDISSGSALKIGASMAVAAQGVEFLLRTFGQIGPAVAAFVAHGAKVSEVEKSYKSLAAAQGLAFDKMLNEGRAATKGLISDFDLMQQANRAMVLGLPMTSDGFAQLSAAAITLGQATGVTATESLERLVGGIGKLETELLDELGLTVKAKDAYDAYAAAHGKTAKALTDTEKKIAFYNATLEQATKATDKLNGVQLNTVTRLEQLSVFWENVRSAAGLAVADSPTINAALGSVAETIEKAYGPGSQGYVAAMTDYMNRFGLGTVQVAEWAVTAFQAIKLGLIGLAQVAVATNPLTMFNKSLKESLRQMAEDTKASFTSQMNSLSELNERMKKAIEEQHANANKIGKETKSGFDDGISGGPAAKAGKKTFLSSFLDEMRDIPKTANEIAKAVRESWEDGLNRAGYAPGIATEFGGVTNVMGKAGTIPLEMPDMAQWIPDAVEEFWKNAPLTQKEIAMMTGKTADEAARWAGALQGVALIAGAIGGKLGETIAVVGNIGKAFEGWSKMDKFGKFNAVAGSVGQIGGLVGGTAGAGIQGAAGGAMTGFSLGGPVGAVVGGLAGGILGIFGGKAKAKAELDELKKHLSGLSDEAKKFGINLDAALASKNSGVVKAAIDQVNAAIKESEKRLAGLSTAAGGLNSFVKGGGITDQASFDRSGMYAGAIFGGQLKETGDAIAALRSIGPALEEMQKKAKDLGLNVGGVVENLLGMNNVLNANEGLADQVSGINQLMKGLSDAGMMTKDMFAALGTDATAVFDKLVAGGATGNQALTLMQPTLQQLYEGQKLHGYAVDEATQKLLDQAKAEGIVGDAFMSANERMVELLGILIETIGGKLPDSYKRAGDAAEDYGKRARNSLPPAPPGPPGPPDPYHDPPPLDPGPGGAHGLAFRNYGTGTRVLLHGEEAVLRREQVDRLVGMAISGEGGGGGGKGGAPVITFGDITVHASNEAGGRAAAKAFIDALKNNVEGIRDVARAYIR